NPRSGQAIRAQAQGIQGGYALVTPLAVEVPNGKVITALMSTEHDHKTNINRNPIQSNPIQSNLI
ncbi:hypothetical protein ACTUL4_003386, partial [Yersinia enterocolitica]